MTAFPAVAGTMLIDLDPMVTPLPIIGWAHTTGLNVSPLVLGHPGPLVAGEGFLLHTDQVYDPGTGRFHESAEDWRESVDEESPYRVGTVLALFAPPVEIKLPVINNTAPPAAALKVPDSGPLDFSGKVYAKASFWQAHTGGREVVFVLTPEHPSPLPPARKITRDAYFEARKTIAEVTLDSLMKPADDQPRLPLGDETDEDDDGNDLI